MFDIATLSFLCLQYNYRQDLLLNITFEIYL